MPPALLTSTSTRSVNAATSRAARAASAISARSARIISTLPVLEAARISFSAAAHRSGSRPMVITRHPCAAKALAVSLPIPELAPVITATRWRAVVMVILLFAANFRYYRDVRICRHRLSENALSRKRRLRAAFGKTGEAAECAYVAFLKLLKLDDVAVRISAVDRLHAAHVDRLLGRKGHSQTFQTLEFFFDVRDLDTKVGVAVIVRLRGASMTRRRAGKFEKLDVAIGGFHEHGATGGVLHAH